MVDNEKELNLVELEEVLYNIDENALTIPELHGYLTAILIAPNLIPPSQWFPNVFNEKGEMPEFKSVEEANYVTRSLLKFYKIVNEEIDDWPEPIMLKKGKGKNAKPDPFLWCLGFINGVSLDEDAWFEKEDENLYTMLLPIYFFVSPEDFNEISKTASGRKKRGFEKEMIQLIPRSIVLIRNYWRSKIPQYSEPQGHVISFNKKKIGRNDPCPCGSGKKYKNCCGKEK